MAAAGGATTAGCDGGCVGSSICVYCSSSDAVASEYVEAARALGELIGRRGHELVYGGGRVGLMGVLARAARAAGAPVTGVIPEALEAKGLAYRDGTRILVTRTMRERKAAMEERADAFVALPGGFGTLEELLEIVTLRQLGYHAKAIAIVNTCGFYDHLLQQFERLYERYFAKPDFRLLYHVAEGPEDAIAYTESYRPTPLPQKWTEPRS
jgi:cytokinin riboside 5'-monophosphate phosphoribohydrolase